MKNIIKFKKVLLLVVIFDIGKYIVESFVKRGYELLFIFINIK
jgi:hypothetical protein